MAEVTVSSKFQIVIPREVRDVMKIKPGQRLDVVVNEFSICLLPAGSIKEMEGFLRGAAGECDREPDREL